MYTILATNIEGLKEKGIAAKDGEISIAVLNSDIGETEPRLYAFRQGMIYNPSDEFKPNIAGNHKLPEKLIEEYFKLKDVARMKLSELKLSGVTSGGNNSGEIIELKKALEQKQARINEQAARITELSNKAPEKNNGGQMDKLEAMIKTLEQVQSNRIELKIGEKTTKILEKVVHENFKKVLALINENEAVYLYGPAGTGKSRLAEDIADALDLNFYPASTITQEFKLTGYKDGNGVFHETNFYKAMKEGGLFFLDEMDSCLPDVLVSINGALASGYFDFPNGTLYAHKDFRVIAAGNTIGRGGNEQYTGRFALDLSTLDRFLGVEINYSEKIDIAVANGNTELVEFAHEVRKTAETYGIIILMSYRAIGKIAKLENMEMFDLPEILNMALIKGIAADDIRMLARNMNIKASNKYYKALEQAA